MNDWVLIVFLVSGPTYKPRVIAQSQITPFETQMGCLEALEKLREEIKFKGIEVTGSCLEIK